MLSKVQTLIEHKNRAISITFSEDICATIAIDNQLIIYLVTSPSHHKLLFKKALEAGSEITN